MYRDITSHHIDVAKGCRNPSKRVFMNVLRRHYLFDVNNFIYLATGMSRIEKLMDTLFAQHRWVVHTFFWFLVLALYVILFGRQNSNYLQTFFFVGLLMPVTIGTTYFLNYFLVPKYLLKGRYVLFVLYFTYTLIGSIFLEMIIALLTFLLVAELQIRNMSPASVDIFFLLSALLMVVFLGMAIKLLLHWRQSREDYQRLMRDKIETELRFLKAQLNPHFLFNTLNNLYYLTTEKSERAPQAILQLSEILDYVMHSGKSVFVPLQEEWLQTKNYVALEMLRYEDRMQVNLQMTGSSENIRIGPMILITLIENAFKHGAMKSAGKSWIKLTVNCEHRDLDLSLRNSCSTGAPGNGIGLNNLRGQLDLLYKERYDLRIDTQTPGVFSMNLTLPKQL